MERCGWATPSDPLYVSYHDSEWGVPLYEERALFELLCLEGAQAGLSWRIILHRREGYRRAFLGFDPERLAGLGDADLTRLQADVGIVRNRQKIASVQKNAQALLAMRAGGERFSQLVWSFVDGRPQIHDYAQLRDVPAHTPESDALSRELRARGFSFVGSTICYAFMQSAGLVMDHVVNCFRHEELKGYAPRLHSARRDAKRPPSQPRRRPSA
ncbi:MAG: DNA-3-methyladenine glycosylase I [Thermaerobacter sp.]|nr:DNA-3-methyladenine glycosylase I [Thermaerobacter sp.]